MHAIILAGGFGTRLNSAIPSLPKPLAPIAGRPFLAWLIDALAAGGIESVTLSVHHQWEMIRDYFEQNTAPIALDYAVEAAPLGTGGAIAHVLRQRTSQEPLLVLNGDTYVKVDYRALYRQHAATKARMTMVLRHVPDTQRYGEAVLNGDTVAAFQPGKPHRSGHINAGAYVLPPDVFSGFALPPAFSFEHDFLERYVQTLSPYYFLADNYFIDIGIPEDYARGCHELPQVLSAA